LNQVSNNGGYGIDISSGSNNRIFENAFIGNNGATGTYNASHAQARDDGTHNLWNYTYVYSWDEPGNYWSDWTTPDVVPPQDIVDYPYIIAGSAGAKDYYPLTYNPRYIGIAFMPLWLS
jgi:parallel beta-helix repeat protein